MTGQTGAVMPPPNEAAAARASFALRHQSGVSFILPRDRASFLVGRYDLSTRSAPDVDLGVLDLWRRVSRRHATIAVAEDHCIVREEPRVANGTCINGRRIEPGSPEILRDGDRLRLADIELTLVVFR